MFSRLVLLNRCSASDATLMTVPSWIKLPFAVIVGSQFWGEREDKVSSFLLTIMEVKGQNCSASSSYCDRLPLGDFNHNMPCGLGTAARSDKRQARLAFGAAPALMFQMNWIPEITVAAAWLIFLATYAVVALGKIPVVSRPLLEIRKTSLLEASPVFLTAISLRRSRLSHSSGSWLLLFSSRCPTAANSLPVISLTKLTFQPAITDRC